MLLLLTIGTAMSHSTVKKTLSKSKRFDAPKDVFIDVYETMCESRFLDEKMMVLLRQGKSYFHIGCAGHEAIQVAAGRAMKKGVDFLFPYYRDQALCMTLGQTAYECLLSFFGRADDPHGGGRQMPMHYGNKRLNIPTSSSSTGTQFLQALGVALANKRDFQDKRSKELAVVVCCAGEGTTSQGEFYEALSWAAREQAPIVFLIENNGYAISVPINEQRPGGLVAENFANFYGLKVMSVDGCDFFKSAEVMEEALATARSSGPVLVDASVVRLLPHSSSDDHKKYRDAAELQEDAARDPLLLFKKRMLADKIVGEKEMAQIELAVKQRIEDASDRAEQASLPLKETALAHVWSDHPEPDLVEPQISQQSADVVFVDAVNRALREALQENDRALVFGQDVAKGKGGVFTATRGLTEEFGSTRCFNAPLAEASIIGVSIGLALRGYVPIPEIQFADYIWTAMMQIRNELATIRYRSNNAFSVPVIIRVPVGGYIHGGLCHSQNIEATFAHFPGLKIALPSTAIDAYGLLKAAVKGEDPVLFLEHKALYRQGFARSKLPNDTNYVLPFGKGAIRAQGSDVTVVTYGILVQRALEAALQLKDEGISVEIIDLRTIVPYDINLIKESVKKTGKLLVLHEDMRFMGFGAEISSEISETCFADLDAPVRRLAAYDAPVPYSSELEEGVLPSAKRIIDQIRDLAQF